MTTSKRTNYECKTLFQFYTLEKILLKEVMYPIDLEV